MPSLPGTHRNARRILLLSAIIFGSLLVQNFWRVGAQSFFARLAALSGTERASVVAAPAGTHTLTAQATSKGSITGVSAAVHLTVNPHDPPSLNVEPTVSLTAPAEGAHFAAGVPIVASAAAADTDGTVTRVEFHADGQLVEIDTTAPFGSTMDLSGGTHTLTATAVDDLGGSTTSAPVTITIDRPQGTQLMSTFWDGQSQFGPSILAQVGPPVNKELADDFNILGDIDRVVVNGYRDFNAPEYPAIRGAYVRFYAWNNGAPGALQDESFLPAGSPGLVYNAQRPSTFDITLPHSFRASGKHFLSVQLLVENEAAYWNWLSANTNNPQNATVKTRDNHAGGTWGPVTDIVGTKNCDAAMAIYGTLTSPGIISGVAPQTTSRSNYFTVTGANFGALQGTSGRLLVDNLPAIIVKWSNTEIVGYVPEAARLGSVPVKVTTAAGTSNVVNLNVTDRRADGRIRWRATVYGDYIDFRAGVAPPGSPDAGSVYANVTGGLTYAWSAAGALKWVARTGLIGGEAPVSVGADGTIYVGSLVPNSDGTNSPAIIALNPNGTQKWQYVADSQSVRAGPSVGPDGKIYAIFRPLIASTSPNLVALAPTDGHLVWNYNDNYYKYGHVGKELFFGAQAGLVYFQYESSTFPNGGFYAHRLDNGQRVAAINNGASDGVVVVAPDQSVHPSMQSYSPLLTTINWIFLLFGQGPTTAPDVGPDNVHYIVQNYYRLYAVNPNGTEKWHYDDTNPGQDFGLLNDPVASPANNLVLMGGRVTYGAPGFFSAVNTQNGQPLWKFYLPDEPGFAPYGQVVPTSRPIFAADGNTAYAAADVAGDGNAPDKYCFFYAINTTAENVPVNQPPQTTITNPLPNTNVAINTAVNVTATVQDDGAIDRVEFIYVHNGSSTPFGTDTTPDASGQYSATFTPTDQGPYGIYVTAYDTGGLRGDASPVSIIANNEPPRINWVSPPNGSTFNVPPSITLTSHASDVDGTVTSVDFNSDQLGLLGTDTTADANGNYSIEWANPPVGTHQLYTWATDNQGIRTSAIITVTINPVPTPTPTPSPTPTPNGNPPVVTITSPADYTNFGLGTNVTITADAHDSDGTIASVDFYRAPFDIHLGSDTTAPYTVSVNSFSPDVWNIVAVATDNNGNVVESSPVHVVWEDPQGGLSISGRIIHQQSSPGHEIYLPNAHVQLLLHGTLVRTTLTDAGGNYLFGNLSQGGEYTVQPAEPGYQFFPPAVIFDGLSENKTWDFTAAGPLPDPEPTPTPALNVAWQNFYDGPQHQADFNPHLAIDSQGNTYVTGTSGSATTGDTDITTIKYSPTGEVLWAVPYYGPGNYKDWANGIKVDAQGNAYVTGVAWGSNTSEYDAVTIKYDADGNQVWAKLYNGPIGHWDRGEALDLIRDGNGTVTGVVVTGYSQTSKPSGALYDELITIKYDASGNQQWVRRRTTAQIADHGEAVAVDAGGNAYVTGFALISPSGGGTTKNFLTLKYAPDGQELWTASFDERGVDPGPLPLPNNVTFEEAGHIALDAAGHVYVAGTNQPGQTGPDFLLLKYDSATGALIWNRNWAGASTDRLRDMALDAAGNILLTGESYDGDYQTATGDETSDVSTVKFDGAGSLLWNRIYRGFPGKWDGGQRVVVDASGNAYVGGDSEGFVNTDSIVIKYQPDGLEAWVFRYDNPNHNDDDLHDLAVDGAGNLYLAGQAINLNASGAETADLLTVKLEPSTSAINSPPAIDLTRVGPTIAGRPDPLDNGFISDPPAGPTIAGRYLTLDASANDRDGTVVRVDFYDGPTLVGTINAPPYTFNWENVPYGQHALAAAATDNSGATRTSPTTLVTTVEAQPLSISGRLTGQNSAGVSAVKMQLSNGSQSVATSTVADGSYSFTNLPAGGSYTITPVKAGDMTGINASDAVLVAQHVAGLSALSSGQQLAGDASDNGTLSAFDAALIAQAAAGIPNNGQAGTWKFLPASRTYNALAANQTNQNFACILVGDVSGNWTGGAASASSGRGTASGAQPPAAAQRAGREQSSTLIQVSLPTQTIERGAAVEVPISVGELSGQGIISYQFDLSFNPAIMQPGSPAIETAGGLSRNCTVAANTGAAGHLTVAAFCLQPLAGQGTLLRLNFNAVGTQGGTTALSWQSFLFNEVGPQAQTSDGRMTLDGVAKSVVADFDGDGRSDVSIWQGDSGKWQIIQSTTQTERLQYWGESSLGDRLVPGDYDGDAKTDIAIFRPSDGNWYLLRSSDGASVVENWGQQGDRPVPADYDGDGKTDLAVFRPSEGNWYIRKTSGGSIARGWGDPADKLVPGDYDGDGKADIAVWRPTDGNWYILLSAGGSRQQQWGLPEDRAVPGDYDGDGRTDIAVYRPSEGNWYVLKSGGGNIIRNWGDPADKAVPGDYDGDGRTDMAVWRPAEGTWYVLMSGSGSVRQVYLGGAGDLLIPLAYLPQ